MKIIYGKEFLADLERNDSFIKITQFAIGNLRPASSADGKSPSLDLQVLFDDYYTYDPDLIGKFDFEAIWESQTRTLRMNLEIPESAKEKLSNNDFEFIYIFYNNYTGSPDKVGFVLADAIWNSPYWNFGSLNLFSGTTDSVDSPMSIGESLGLEKNYFEIRIPKRVEGEIQTNLTNNAFILEGPGVIGSNWYSEDSVSLISRESYEAAVLEKRSEVDSLTYPYLTGLGEKKYESFRYREYTSFTISADLSPNYLYPRAAVFSLDGGVLEIDGTAEYTEYLVENGVASRIGSGVSSIGQTPGIKIDITPGGDSSIEIGNTRDMFFAKCNKKSSAGVDQEFRSELTITLNWRDPITSNHITLFPNNLRDGKILIIQNEDSRWLVSYPETKFFEGTAPMYLFEHSPGQFRDIVIKTKLPISKRDLKYTLEEPFTERFLLEIMEYQEYYDLFQSQIDTYVAQLRTVESRLLSTYEIRSTDKEQLGRKIDGVLSGALLRTWTFTPEQFELLTKTKDFCIANNTLLQEFYDIDGNLVSYLTNIIEYFTDKVTTRPGRSEYFENELSQLLEGDRVGKPGEYIYSDYRGFYQYSYLLSQFDKWSSQVAIQQMTYENNIQAKSVPLGQVVESELAGYLGNNISAYFSQLFHYLILSGDKAKMDRYDKTMEAFLKGATIYKKSPWTSTPGDFYIRVTTLLENDSLTDWFPQKENGEPYLITLHAQYNGFLGSVQFYCIQKPKTLTLYPLDTQSGALFLGYPSDNEPIVSETFRIGVKEGDMDGFSDLRWTLINSDYRLSVPTVTGLLGEIPDESGLLVSQSIEVTSQYRSRESERTYFNDLTLLAIPGTYLPLPEIDLTDWRQNLYLSRLDIPVIGRGYRPEILEYTSQIDLLGIGYYQIRVRTNTDLVVESTLSGLVLEDKKWVGQFTEGTPLEIDLYFKYTGAPDEIMTMGQSGYRVEVPISLIPYSEDLEYWYPEGYLIRTITTRINLAASTKFVVTPESTALYIKPGEQRDIEIESPGRRVYTTGSAQGSLVVSEPNPEMSPLDPTRPMTAYQKHLSSISTDGSVSAVGFPITTSYHVDYWSSGLKGTTLTGYDIYILPDKDFVTVSGSLSGSPNSGYYLYLGSSAFSSASLTFTSISGVQMNLEMSGSGFTVSGFDDSTQSRQIITVTPDDSNESVDDITLGTIELTSWVPPSEIVSGKNLGTILPGNTFLITVIQTGLHGKMGLGNSNDLSLPIGGAQDRTLLGTITRPGESYPVSIDTTGLPDGCTIWLGDWSSDSLKAPLYISGLQPREGYTPSLVYKRDAYEWKGIYGSKTLGKVIIKVGSSYTETHNLILPGIQSGTMFGEKFYLGPSIITIPVSTDTYTIWAGEYPTANRIQDQIGTRIYPTCPTGVTVTKNLSPGEITFTLPPDPGEYPIILGKLTLILDKVTSTYRVEGDSTLEIDARGNMMSSVQIFGVLPYGMTYSQVFPSKDDTIVGYIGTDGVAQVWLDEYHGQTDLISGSITLKIPGQDESAGKIDYIQHTAYVNVTDKTFNFTNSGTDIVRNVAMIGQVNTQFKPILELDEWPSFIDAEKTTVIIVESASETYQLICSLSIKSGSGSISDFAISGTITAEYLMSGGQKFKVPVAYTFHYIEE